jgi:hypothetical protein
MMKKDTTAYGAERPAWDKADCSVRALAVATGVPYAVASAVFSARGRKLKAGTPVILSDELYTSILGMRRVEMAEGIRLEAFLEVAKTGRFVVHKIGHAFAVVEGVVHDWEGTSRGATCLTRVYRVTEAARAKMAKMGELLA